MILHVTPHFSQHLHIKDKDWKQKSCGIVCLAMILNYFGKNIPPEKLLEIGLNFKFSYKGSEYFAHTPSFNWIHWGLARIAKKFGFQGIVYDWSVNNEVCKKLNKKAAFDKLTKLLEKYPLMASLNKTFSGKGKGHLIVLTGIDKNRIFYNDPDYKIKKHSCKNISKTKFLKHWTKRTIVVFDK
ncbi:MAG: cysteine peptidase family C39 domain-containing protein [bacterium]|nr:cysteine peptidase family C39 domain-containing protein [bacterium]